MGTRSLMQYCDATCQWCSRHFFRWLRDRMYSAQRSEGRSGAGSFADAAATSNVAAPSRRAWESNPVLADTAG